MKITKQIFILLILPIFFGCSFKETKALDIYTLRASKPQNIIKKTKFNNYTLMVLLPKSENQIRKNRILYATTPNQRENYAFSRWSDTPNHLIAQNLLSYLDETGIFKAVIFENTRAKSDLILESYIEDFYQNFENNKDSYAIVNIRFFLIDAKSKKVISKRDFKIKTKSPSSDAKGAVRAFNNSIETLCLKLQNWLLEVP